MYFDKLHHQKSPTGTADTLTARFTTERGGVYYLQKSTVQAVVDGKNTNLKMPVSQAQYALEKFSNHHS